MMLPLALAACGGATSKPASGPEGQSASQQGSSAGDNALEEDTSSRGPDCSDGTCFACGSGICPSGFYCDQGAPGGPACSWLPECASKNSCSCVQKGLGSGCSCEDRDGGLYVSCN